MAKVKDGIAVKGLHDLRRRCDIEKLGFIPIRKFFNDVGKDVKAESKKVLDQYDKNDTGKLRSSIKYKKTKMKGRLPGGVRIEATKPYASFVHGDIKKAFKGAYKEKPKWSRTEPHWPPMRALSGWADRKGIPVFLVAKSISEKGTPIVPFLKIGYDNSEDKIEAHLLVCSNRIERNWKKSRKKV